MNARRYIEEALIQLLKTKSIDKIKVSEVIREVGTCKGTFYKYYCDKYDLLQKCFENRVYSKAVCDDFETFMRRCLEEFAKIPEASINAFDSHDVNSLKSYNKAIVVARMRDNCERLGIELGKIEFEAMNICAAGCTEFILEWLKGGAETKDIDALIDYMSAAVPRIIAIKHGAGVKRRTDCL